MVERSRPLTGRQVLVVSGDEAAAAPFVQVLLGSGAWVSVLPWAPESRDRDSLGDLVLVCARTGRKIVERTVRSVRQSSFAPVIAASDPSVMTAAEAFEAGVDQWVDSRVVATDSTEFRAKLRGLLLRATPTDRMPDQLEGPQGLLVRPHVYEAFLGVAPVRLTPTELRLLAQLLRYRGEVLSTPRLGELVWSDARRADDVHQHIMTTRRKLEGAGLPELIATVRGVGYVVR